MGSNSPPQIWQRCARLWPAGVAWGCADETIGSKITAASLSFEVFNFSARLKKANINTDSMAFPVTNAMEDPSAEISQKSLKHSHGKAEGCNVPAPDNFYSPKTKLSTTVRHTRRWTQQKGRSGLYDYCQGHSTIPYIASLSTMFRG